MSANPTTTHTFTTGNGHQERAIIQWNDGIQTMTDALISSTTTAQAINPKTGKRIVGRPFQPGVSGNPGGSPDRARRALNAETISALHAAFRRGGYEAIDKVMTNNPAMFLKLLVLLVPREMEITHKGGVKAMSDEQLENALATLKDMMAKKLAGAEAKQVQVIDAIPNPPDSEIPPRPAPRPKRMKRGRTDDNMGEDMGTE